MRACLIGLLLAALGCTNSAQKLQCYEAATSELASLKANLTKYENEIATSKGNTILERKEEEEFIDFLKSKIERLQTIDNENRP